MVDVTIRRYRSSRRLRIIIRPGGQVVVTAPPRVAEYRITEFVRQNQDWIADQVERSCGLPIRSKQSSRNEFLAMRKEARSFVNQRLAFYRHVYGISHGRVSIRNQQTRWGSCSREKNLSFNYRIVKLPLALADYVIVHELCHCVELNHSAKFWALVRKAIPNYTALRRSLRAYGKTLDF